MAGWQGAPRLALLGLASIGALGIGLHLARRRWSSHVTNGLFLLQAAVATFAIWCVNETQAYTAPSSAPFFGGKVISLVVILLAPSEVAGIVVLAVNALAPVVQFLGWPHEVQVRVFPAEPWLSSLVGLMAIGVLIARYRSLNRLRAAVGDQTERDWLARVARLSLLVRDLWRAPLEQLQQQIASVRAGCRDITPFADRMQRATARLVELNDALRPFEAYLAPRPETLRTLDAALIEREVSELVGERAGARR
jgi:hypothetical protein